MLLAITVGTTHNTDLPGQLGFGGGTVSNVLAAVSNVHETGTYRLNSLSATWSRRTERNCSRVAYMWLAMVDSILLSLCDLVWLGVSEYAYGMAASNCVFSSNSFSLQKRRH